MEQTPHTGIIKKYFKGGKSQIFRNRKTLLKFAYFLLAALFVIVVIPKNYKFEYDFNKGQAWKYDDLTAPFDFALVKSPEQINKERELIRFSNRLYFVYSEQITNTVLERFSENFKSIFPDWENNKQLRLIYNTAHTGLETVLRQGVLSDGAAASVRLENEIVSLVKNKVEKEIIFSEFYLRKQALDILEKKVADKVQNEEEDKINRLFDAILLPNVSFDENMTQSELSARLEDISPRYSLVPKGKLIISKGEPISESAYIQLSSLKQSFSVQQNSQQSGLFSWLGYSVVVLIIFITLFMVMYMFKRGKYFHYKHILLILFNMLVSFTACYVLTRFSPYYIYIIPICLQTIVLRSFFNARVAFMVHLFTVFLCGFLAPNVYMYIMVGVITGVACAFTSNVIYHRSRLFASVVRITGLSILTALGILMIQNASITVEGLNVCVYLLMAGILMLFAQPIIFVYEKIFSLVSDISLLELTDNNSPLLRLLCKKAPGTFQHALSVANIAEEAARQLGANVLLTRVGALYHDIGKINDPAYFVENQSPNYNPHDELPTEQSVDIIRAHVASGLELAKKYGLPPVVSDFIRSHHGRSVVFFFYKKAVEMYGEKNVNIDDYRYDFRSPNTKEEAILMICDSVEAASRSMKIITKQTITSMVNSVVERQTKDGQFDSADISYREISHLRSFLIRQIMEIYHSRIEYQKD